MNSLQISLPLAWDRVVGLFNPTNDITLQQQEQHGNKTTQTRHGNKTAVDRGDAMFIASPQSTAVFPPNHSVYLI